MIANIGVVGRLASCFRGRQVPYRPPNDGLHFFFALAGRASRMASAITMPLELEHRDLAPTTALVTLNGKLLLGQDAARLGDLVPELIAAGHKNLVFDLGGVTHIDSTGIGRFIDAYARVQKIGGKMRLAGAKGAVRESFHVTRLDTVFSFYPSVEAATQDLG